jgi:hypothetical protein
MLARICLRVPFVQSGARSLLRPKVEGAGRYPFYANYSEKFESELADALSAANRAAP